MALGQIDHVKLDQLLGAINDFQLCLNSGGRIDTLFLDFAKAFDKVCHSKLCYKLSSYDINGEVLSWIMRQITNSCI